VAKKKFDVETFTSIVSALKKWRDRTFLTG